MLRGIYPIGNYYINLQDFQIVPSFLPCLHLDLLIIQCDWRVKIEVIAFIKSGRERQWFHLSVESEKQNQWANRLINTEIRPVVAREKGWVEEGQNSQGEQEVQTSSYETSKPRRYITSGEYNQ